MLVSASNTVATEQPAPSPFGLLSPAVTVVENNDERWIRGFPYETFDGTAEVSNWPIAKSSSNEGSVVLENQGLPVARLYYPFDIKASITSSTMGTNPEEVYETAKQALDVVTQKAIEHEFWSGEVAKNVTESFAEGTRYLSHEDAIDVTPDGGAVRVRYGQALLEQALGEATIGSAGVIHAPRLIASALEASDVDGALTTNLGTKVVAGSGYSNTGPDGAIAPTGKAWMYATGPVTVNLGKLHIVPGTVSQAVDSKVNTITYFVDRPAAVTWSTSLLYAVLVDLTLDYV